MFIVKYIIKVKKIRNSVKKSALTSGKVKIKLSLDFAAGSLSIIDVKNRLLFTNVNY